MPGTELLLEVSRALVALGLAVFVGAPLAKLLGRKRNFLESEDGKGGGSGSNASGVPNRSGDDASGRAKFVAAGGLLVGVLLEVQVLGSSLSSRHVWRAVTLFLLVASLVSTVMVVLPRERYYRQKSLSLEEKLRQPWVNRADAARRRALRIDLLCFVLALVALVLG